MGNASKINVGEKGQRVTRVAPRIKKWNDAVDDNEPERRQPDEIVQFGVEWYDENNQPITDPGRIAYLNRRYAEKKREDASNAIHE